MNWTPRRSMAAMALVGLLSMSVAHAGLGAIQVLSEAGEPFAALIPFVDVLPGNAVAISLADRNRYPMLSPYSPSAGQLQFTLQKKLDGTPIGILVTGPAKFAEAELDFAVSMGWSSGGAVREYQVDYRLESPSRRQPAPPPRDDGKKPVQMVHGFPSWSDLGMSGLSVRSLPGQPLVAETEVFGHGLALHHELRVRIMPESGQGQPAAQMLQQVASMRHALVRVPSGAYVLQLSSDVPITTPVFGFRLDLALGKARMTRRYALESRDGVFVVTERTVRGRASSFKVLRVLPGDSLSVIASRLRHDGLSLRDVVTRLYQENPHAFISGDINKLIAGAQLKYPEAWTRAATPGVESGAVAASARQVPPPAPRAAPASGPVQAAAAALQQRLMRQDAMLSQAEKVSGDLERKLQQMHALQASSELAAPMPVSALPNPLQRLDGALTSPVVALAGGGAALAAAAAAVALLLRRRRRAKQQGVASNSGEPQPTIDGMRQWLRYEPTRDDLRYRLLQLLTIADDVPGFIQEAELALTYFGADSPMWRGVVEMGQVLAPDYPWNDTLPQPSALAGAAPLGVLAPDAPTESAAARPERPLVEAGDWDGFAPAAIAFNEPRLEPEIEPAREPDKQELAQLYREMGDIAAADELMRATGAH